MICIDEYRTGNERRRRRQQMRIGLSKKQLSSSFSFFNQSCFLIFMSNLFLMSRHFMCLRFSFSLDRIFKWSCCFGNSVAHFGSCRPMYKTLCLLIDLKKKCKLLMIHVLVVAFMCLITETFFYERT